MRTLDVKQFYTDDWKAFSAVLPADRHQIGKADTKHIEAAAVRESIPALEPETEGSSEEPAASQKSKSTMIIN